MPDVYTDNPTEFFQSVDRDPDDGGDTVTTFQLMWGTPPVDREQNEYWQELEKRLGVTFEPQFVPAPTFDSKFSTMLASGNIPDLVFVDDQSATQLQAIRDGAFADLSEVLGGDGIQKWPNLAARTPDIWQASLKNGRIYQIPSAIARITNLVVMRRDAFEETSIGPEPADADELMTALTEISQTTRDGQKIYRSEEHTPELQSRGHLVCRLLLEKKKSERAHARAAPAAPLPGPTCLASVCRPTPYSSISLPLPDALPISSLGSPIWSSCGGTPSRRPASGRSRPTPMS